MLREGMFFTIEPMINAGRWEVKILADGWTAVTKDRSLSAQFEHSIGVTADGYEVFTLLAGRPRPPALSTSDLMPATLTRHRHAAPSDAGVEPRRRRTTPTTGSDCGTAFLERRRRSASPITSCSSCCCSFRSIGSTSSRWPRRCSPTSARLGAVLAAEPTRLAPFERVNDRTCALFKAMREAARRMLREDIADRPVISSWTQLIDYCRISLADEPVERFRVLFLDRKNKLIADELQQTRHRRSHARSIRAR